MEQQKKQEDRKFVSREVLVRMEIFSMLVASIVLMVLALLRPAPLGAPADPLHTPPHVSAPWIFAGIQELLRYLPPLLAGLLIPLAVLFALTFLPFIQTRPTEEGTTSLGKRVLPFVLLVSLLLFIILFTLLHIFH
jgi:quinol-cytochrome oxidoreductase complex cytochrome b subunit